VPRKLFNLLPPLVLMAVIFLLSAQPDLSTGLGFWDLVLRKLAHMSVYALLTLLWWRALAPLAGRPLAVAVTIAFLYAISDEYHQSFVEGRSGNPVDVMIDSVGIGLAVWLARSDWFRRGPARRFSSLGGAAPDPTAPDPMPPDPRRSLTSSRSYENRSVGQCESSAVDSDSDINYIPAIIGFFVAIIAVVAAFFLIGPVAGIIVVLVVLALALYLGYRLMTQDEN